MAIDNPDNPTNNAIQSDQVLHFGFDEVLDDAIEFSMGQNAEIMNNFPDVFDFHETRFSQSENVPILFAWNFNAVPHTDGGRSPASKKMLESGFRDAFRKKYHDIKKYPGACFQAGSRIDQLCYEGSGLKNGSTQVPSTWPSRFPSDHFLIKSVFVFDYTTTRDD